MEIECKETTVSRFLILVERFSCNILHNLGPGAVEANSDKNGGEKWKEWEGDGRGSDGKRVDFWWHSNPRDQNLNRTEHQNSEHAFIVGWSIGWIENQFFEAHYIWPSPEFHELLERKLPIITSIQSAHDICIPFYTVQNSHSTKSLLNYSMRESSNTIHHYLQSLFWKLSQSSTFFVCSIYSLENIKTIKVCTSCILYLSKPNLQSSNELRTYQDQHLTWIKFPLRFQEPSW